MSDDKLKKIKKRLKETGLVKYQLEEGATSFKDQHHFLINPVGITDYNNLQILEDITKDLILEDKLMELGEAKLSIRGNLTRDIFYKVHHLFDESKEIKLKGYVKGDRIKAEYQEKFYSESGPINIILTNTSLEEISRIMETEALDNCSLKLKLETGEGKTKETDFWSKEIFKQH